MISKSPSMGPVMMCSLIVMSSVSCLDEKELLFQPLEKNVQTLSAQDRPCDTAAAKSYLHGAVVAANPADFGDFGQDGPCLLPFVDIYQYVNGVYTDPVKEYCQAQSGTPTCTLPQSAVQCFEDLQQRLWNLPTVVPAEPLSTSQKWTWTGLVTTYAFSKIPLITAIDSAVERVRQICPQNQGQALDSIRSQLRSMPVSDQIANSFRSMQDIQNAQRQIASGDVFYLLKGFLTNCYKNLGYLLPAPAVYNSFPL